MTWPLNEKFACSREWLTVDPVRGTTLSYFGLKSYKLYFLELLNLVPEEFAEWKFNKFEGFETHHDLGLRDVNTLVS